MTAYKLYLDGDNSVVVVADKFDLLKSIDPIFWQIKFTRDNVVVAMFNYSNILGFVVLGDA